MSDPVEPELDDLSLDAVFAEAKAETVPSDGLMDRIIADAAAVAEPDPVVAPRVGMWDRMLDAVGGWPSLSGLATAAVAGIYIGFSDPTLLDVVGLGIAENVTEDLLLGDDVFFDETVAAEG